MGILQAHIELGFDGTFMLAVCSCICFPNFFLHFVVFIFKNSSIIYTHVYTMHHYHHRRGEKNSVSVFGILWQPLIYE